MRNPSMNSFLTRVWTLAGLMIALSGSLLLCAATPCLAAGNISTTHKWAWASNGGWINFNPTHGGMTVYTNHLEGYAWAENTGWMRLGTRTSGGTHTYANTSAANYGVNRQGSGLYGFAWASNAGWINFNPTHGGVAINPTTGAFSGYAWGENIGWIKFAGTAQNNSVYGLQANTHTVTLMAGSGGRADGSGAYISGAGVTVQATADSGYVFVNWTEGSTVVSCENVYAFTATGNRTLRANFSQAQSQYSIAGSVNPVNFGTVTGSGAYAHGANVSLTALPKQGFAMVHWIETWPGLEGACVVSTDARYTFTATRNRTLTANIRPKALPGVLMLLLD